MEKNNIQKLSALFLIVLMLSLPITFAATTLTITSFAGADEVQGSMREFDDALTVEAEVTPDAEEDSFANFSENNLFIEIFGKEEAFDSCEAEGDSYLCIYTTATADRTPAEKTLLVSVIDDDSQRVASEENTFIIDGEAPTIVSIDYPSYFIDEVNITLELEDTACSGCGDACSSFDRIEIALNNSVKQNLTLDIDPGDCDYEETIETSVTELDIAEGKQQLCVLVYDNVQNSDKKCATVIVDSTAPSLSSSSFVVKDEKGNALEHLGTEAVHATVSVNITETGSGLALDSIYANLSALHEEIGDEYNEISGDCTEYENSVFVCLWDVYVYFSETAEKIATVKIYAEDNVGNSQTLTKTMSFVEDTTAPVLLSLESAFPGYLNAKNNTLILEMQEEGSGFDDVNVYLNMQEALLGQRQADDCQQSGTLWYCYWENFAIPSAVPHGESIDIMSGAITDDAGNSYDATTSFEEETFVFDEEAPEFINVTIGALGREAAVITEGDVVFIDAFITDDVSGIDAANVYADYSAFEDSNDWEAAQACTEVTTDVWECYWEYTGALDAGESVELTMKATDNGGNAKDSDDDNVVAEIEVVGIAEQVVDYWQEAAAVDDAPMLNSNFLYFTSTGTLVRLDTVLESKTGFFPFIHAYQINSCEAAPKLAENLTASLSWSDASIVGQYYYDISNKAEKYVLINIPAFFYGKNATVAEGSTIEVQCTATVTQAKTEFSDIYSPNEEVNISVSVPLMAGLYTEPSLASIDKIQKLEKLIKLLDVLTKFLGAWSKWGTKICSPINGVRVIANNIVTMLKAIDTLSAGGATEAVAGGVKVTNFLNGFWYGARNEEKYKGTITEQKIIGKEGELGVEKFYSADADKAFQNKYKIPSFGYICDTVLCESCSESWNKLLLKGDADLPQGMYIGGEWIPNLVGRKFTVPLNPQENLVIAAVCNPPCVPGIYGQLNVYKEILIAYNTCLNVAAIKGEDLIECEQFLQAQICQNMVNAFFWHWFWGLRKVVLANAVGLVIDYAREELAECPAFQDTANPVTTSCSVYRSGVAFFTLGSTLVDTYNTINNLFAMNWNMSGNQTAEEQQDELQSTMEQEIGAQLGTTPTYG